MKAVLLALLASLRAGFRSRTALQLKVLALRHQLAVYQRCPARPRTKVADRLLWAWLSRTWAGWRDALGRRLTSSRSWWGVFFPFLDFFWKA